MQVIGLFAIIAFVLYVGLGPVIFLLVLLGLLIWALVKSSTDRSNESRRALSEWTDQVKKQLQLSELVLNPQYGVGVDISGRRLAVLDANGEGSWIGFNRIAQVELIPFYTRRDESSSETSTRRGSQFLGAGIGAAVAGPAGLIVGGLSGKQTISTQGSSSEYLSKLELKLRLRSDRMPMLKIAFSEHLDGVELMAARLANAVDESAGPAPPGSELLETFQVKCRPVVADGLWKRTFG